MKKINLKQTNIILLRISIFFIIISIICGISIDIFFLIKLNSLPEMNIDNSDFSIFFKMIGYMVLPSISIVILVFCVAGALIIDGIMWGIYGLIRIIKKLIKEKRWNVFITIGIVIAIIILILITINVMRTPRLEDSTIWAMLYDYVLDYN